MFLILWDLIRFTLESKTDNVFSIVARFGSQSNPLCRMIANSDAALSERLKIEEIMILGYAQNDRHDIN